MGSYNFLSQNFHYIKKGVDISMPFFVAMILSF
jgi:hypothetical protein